MFWLRRPRLAGPAVFLLAALMAGLPVNAAGRKPAARKTPARPAAARPAAPKAGSRAARAARPRRPAVPPRAPADIPVVDHHVSTSEGCVAPSTPALLSPRLNAAESSVREFLLSSGVPLEPSDVCVPYVVVTGGSDGVASLHVPGASWLPPATDPVHAACLPERRVIEVPASEVQTTQAGPLVDVPDRVRWQVEVLVPDMLNAGQPEDAEPRNGVVRLVLERRGAGDVERLRSIEVLDPVTRRRTDGAWWVERADGSGVLFGMRGTDYERLLWHSPVHFERVSRGVGPATRVVQRVVKAPKGSGRANRVTSRVVKPRGYHLGIDMMADRGQDVHVVSDGRVGFAGSARGFGNLVIVEHGGGYRTYYAHLSAFARGLKAGDVLLRGDVLGLVGSTGRSTGPHLHFETRLQSDYIDPLNTGRQLGFWMLTDAEQAWVARQMLAPEPIGIGGVEPQPRGVSLVVAGSGTSRVEPWLVEPTACRAFLQPAVPERPELAPPPSIRAAGRKPVRPPRTARAPASRPRARASRATR